MYFKKMTGKKCYLSPMNKDDAEKYTEWLNDEELINYIAAALLPITVSAEREIIDTLSKNHNYAIVDLQTDNLIGNCGLLDIDHLNQICEIGIFIGDKNFWGKGYGTEALSLLIDYTFMKLNINNIMLKVYSFNKRAIRCYEKTGFKKIGVRRNALHRNRKIHDLILMDILPDDFYSRPVR